MKKWIVIVAAMLLAMNVNAQQMHKNDVRYRGFIEVGPTVRLDEPQFILQMSTSHGAALGSVFVGAGIGSNSYFVYSNDYDAEDLVRNGVDLFVNIKGDWDQFWVMPSLDFKMGTSFGYAHGVMGELGVGVRFRLNRLTALGLNAYFKAIYESPDFDTADTGYEDGLFAMTGVKLFFEF